MNFQEWMDRVDCEIEKICGLASSDLADYAFMDAFEDGASPKEIAIEVLANESYGFQDWR